MALSENEFDIPGSKETKKRNPSKEQHTTEVYDKWYKIKKVMLNAADLSKAMIMKGPTL